jgi:fido (protein-threonine AMPylation protein)
MGWAYARPALHSLGRHGCNRAILIKAEGQPFVVGPAIPAALDDIGTKLREADNLRSLPREQFAERAADVMIALNDAHPFREGNGRTQRAFMRELAKEAGHELDFFRGFRGAHDPGEHRRP